MRILSLTEGFRKTEFGLILSADSECNEEQAAASEQKFIRFLSF